MCDNLGKGKNIHGTAQKKEEDRMGLREREQVIPNRVKSTYQSSFGLTFLSSSSFTDIFKRSISIEGT